MTSQMLEQPTLEGLEEFLSTPAAKRLQRIDAEVVRLRQVALEPRVTLEVLPHPLGPRRTHVARVAGLEDTLLCDAAGLEGDRLEQVIRERIRRLGLERDFLLRHSDN